MNHSRTTRQPEPEDPAEDGIAAARAEDEQRQRDRQRNLTYTIFGTLRDTEQPIERAARHYATAIDIAALAAETKRTSYGSTGDYLQAQRQADETARHAPQQAKQALDALDRASRAARARVEQAIRYTQNDWREDDTIARQQREEERGPSAAALDYDMTADDRLIRTTIYKLVDGQQEAQVALTSYDNARNAGATPNAATDHAAQALTDWRAEQNAGAPDYDTREEETRAANWTAIQQAAVDAYNATIRQRPMAIASARHNAFEAARQAGADTETASAAAEQAHHGWSHPATPAEQEAPHHAIERAIADLETIREIDDGMAYRATRRLAAAYQQLRSAQWTTLNDDERSTLYSALHAMRADASRRDSERAHNLIQRFNLEPQTEQPPADHDDPYNDHNNATIAEAAEVIQQRMDAAYKDADTAPDPISGSHLRANARRLNALHNAIAEEWARQ